MAARERASSSFGHMSYLSGSSYTGNTKTYKDYRYQPPIQSSSSGTGDSASPSYTYEPSSYSNLQNGTSGNSNSIYLHTQSSYGATYHGRQKGVGGSTHYGNSVLANHKNNSSFHEKPGSANAIKGNIYLNNHRRSMNIPSLSTNINNNYNNSTNVSKNSREAGDGAVSASGIPASYYHDGAGNRSETNGNNNNNRLSHNTASNANKNSGSTNSNSRYMSAYNKIQTHDGQYSSSSSSSQLQQQGGGPFSTGVSESQHTKSADSGGIIGGAGFYSNGSNEELRTGNVATINGNMRNSQISRSAGKTNNVLNHTNNISVYPSSYNVNTENLSNVGSGIGSTTSARPRSEYGYHKGNYFTGYSTQLKNSLYNQGTVFSNGRDDRENSKEFRIGRRHLIRADSSRDRHIYKDDFSSTGAGNGNRSVTKTRERMRPSSSIPAPSSTKNRSKSFIGERDVRGAYSFSTDQLGAAQGVDVSAASLHNFHNAVLNQQNIHGGFTKSSSFDIGGITTNASQTAYNLYRNHPSYAQSQTEYHQGPNASGQYSGNRYRARTSIGARHSNTYNTNAQEYSIETNETNESDKNAFIGTNSKRYMRPNTPIQAGSTQSGGTGAGIKEKETNQGNKGKQLKKKKKAASVGVVVTNDPNQASYSAANSIEIDTSKTHPIPNGDLPSDDRSKGSLDSFVSDDNTIVTIIKETKIKKNDGNNSNKTNNLMAGKFDDRSTAQGIIDQAAILNTSSSKESKKIDKDEKRRHRRNRSSSSSVSSAASENSTNSSFSSNSEVSANITIASVSGTNQSRERSKIDKDKAGKTARKAKANQEQQQPHQNQQQQQSQQNLPNKTGDEVNGIKKEQLNGNSIEKRLMNEGGRTMCHNYQANFPQIPNIDEDPYSNVQRMGVSSVKGRRMYMEDEYRGVCNTELLIPPNSKPSLDSSFHTDSDNLYGQTFDQNPPLNVKTSFWAVFDGHAGGRCSKALASSVVVHCARDPEYYSNLSNAVVRGFHRANQEFLKKADKYLMNDGSTGTAALYRSGLLVVGNVGDSRCVLCSSGRAVPLSIDQKPNRPEEKKRIVSFGGKVVNCFGVHRVNGVLAVARAFGNRALRQVIRADAEVQERILHEGDDFLILASDGLWDTMTNQECCDIVCRYANQMSLSAIAEILTTTSIRKGSMDNVTALVVDLRGLSVEAIERKGAEQRYNDNSLNDTKKQDATTNGGMGKEIEEEKFQQYMPIVHHREQLEQQEYHLNLLRENHQSETNRPLTVMHSSVYKESPSDLE